MTITAAIVMYAMIWFLVLFIVLPMRLQSQGEAGHVVPGTPSSAPVDPGLRRKVRVVTVAATVIWAIVVMIIVSGVISVRDIDFFNRMSPPSVVPPAGETGG